MSKEKQISYSEAMSELESLVKAIERESIPVDELAEKVKRASELISICRQRLKTTEVDVQKILKEINEEE
jgi:exodeoxyribonuclease VII small subunit